MCVIWSIDFRTDADRDSLLEFSSIKVWQWYFVPINYKTAGNASLGILLRS